MKTNQYVVAYLIRRGRADWPRAKGVEATNAQEARAKFDEWYFSQPSDKLPHPFHITVKRLNGLVECPLCGSVLRWRNSPNAECPKYACGLKITTHDPDNAAKSFWI